VQALCITLEIIMQVETYRNEEEGLEALVMDGNDRFPFRVVFRDSDADATLLVRFSRTYKAAMISVYEFLSTGAAPRCAPGTDEILEY